MYERWDAKRCRMRTTELLDEQLFCDLYDTLKEITTEYDEPSPAELWEEATMRWKPYSSKHRLHVSHAFCWGILAKLRIQGDSHSQLGQREFFQLCV